MSKYIVLLLAIFTYIAVSTATFAYNIPTFTSCLNPQGEVKANYETGIHGIPGDSTSYEGKDTVYNLSGNELTQCFCAVDGSGIQTNWWKVSSLTEAEINILKSEGWVYIPNGALWGLQEAPYLAFNSKYICNGGGGGGGGGSEEGGCCSPTTDIPGPGGSGGQGGGSVLGISTSVGEVLGLASTGNTAFLLLVLIISVSSSIAGIILKIRQQKLYK